MKRNHAIRIVSGLIVVFAVECQAQFNGSDDFNDNVKDSARWGSDFSQGGGLFTEKNARLEFTTSGIPSSSALGARPWVLNFGSYTQDWEVRIDANLPVLGFPETLFGLIVASGTNVSSANRMQWTLFESSSEGRLFLLKYGQTGSSFDRIAELATASTLVGLRVAFDATTKNLSAYYDANGPSGGYTWTLLATTNISTAWGMTSTNIFSVWVFGRVQETTRAVTSADNLFGDNFYASSVSGTSSAPSLLINSAGGTVVVSWPTNASAYHLQSATALVSPVDWQDLTNPPPAMVSTNFTVTNSALSGARFYRLKK